MPPRTNPPSATHVADYLLAAAALDHGLELDEPRLNELLHITNDTALQKHNRPAFRDPVEVWKHGPAIRAVREAYWCWGDSPIRVLDICRTALADKPAVVGRKKDLLGVIGTEVCGVVDGVLDQYVRTGGKPTLVTRRGDTFLKGARSAGQ